MSKINLPAVRGYYPISNELPVRAIEVKKKKSKKAPRKEVAPRNYAPEMPVRPVERVQTLSVVDPVVMRRFLNYSPSYHTKVGAVTSKLVSVERRNGVDYGFYAVVVENEMLRQTETTVWQYAHHDGQIEEVRRYSSRTDPWE